jgi:hypothetical protein
LPKGGRAKKSDLFAGGNRFEGSPESNLRFAESDIAAKEPIHDLRLLHIRFDLFERTILIGGQRIREFVFEFLLKFIIRREGKPGLFGPLAIKSNQTVSEFVDPFLDVGFLFGPIAPGEMGEFRHRAFAARVFAD